MTASDNLIMITALDRIEALEAALHATTEASKMRFLAEDPAETPLARDDLVNAFVADLVNELNARIEALEAALRTLLVCCELGGNGRPSDFSIAVRRARAALDKDVGK